MDKNLLRGGLFGFLAAISSGIVPVMFSLLLRRNTDFLSIIFIITLITIALIIRYIIFNTLLDVLQEADELP